MKRRTFIVISAVLAIGAAYIAVTGEEKGTSTKKSEKVPAATVSERIDYFASHGWEVEEIAGKQITIPDDFSQAYEEYALIQDRQGLPLREYAGKNGHLYVYEVKNYSPESRKMLAELLVCGDTAVASMIYSEDGGSLRLPVV